MKTTSCPNKNIVSPMRKRNIVSTIYNAEDIVQCPHCKVRHKQTVLVCPVCRKSAADSLFEETIPSSRIMRKKKALFLLISFMLLIVPCAVSVMVNHMISHNLTWSRAVLVALFASWTYMITIVLFHGIRDALFAVLVPQTAVVLFFVNVATDGRWFFSLALPLLMLWSLTVYLVTVYAMRCILCAFKINGVVMTAVVVTLLGTELIIDYNCTSAISIGWSLITAASVLPVAAVMFILHVNRKKLERWTHL